MSSRTTWPRGRSGAQTTRRLVAGIGVGRLCCRLVCLVGFDHGESGLVGTDQIMMLTTEPLKTSASTTKASSIDSTTKASSIDALYLPSFSYLYPIYPCGYPYSPPPYSS